jgi:hypothetical protein
MIKKGSVSPVQVRKGKYGYNVWIFDKTTVNRGQEPRHHFKMMNRYESYVSQRDAIEDGWKFVNHRVKRMDNR